MVSVFLWELCFLFSLYATVRNVTGLYLNFNDLRGGYLERPTPLHPPPSLERSPYWLLSLKDQYFMSLCYSCDPGGTCPSIGERDHWKLVVRPVPAGFLVEESEESMWLLVRGNPCRCFWASKVCFYLGVSHLSMDDRPCWDLPVKLFKPGAFVIFF